MLRNHADHTHNTVALNNLALIANFLNTSSNFHDSFAFRASSFLIRTGGVLRRVRTDEPVRRKKGLYPGFLCHVIDET